MSTSEISRLEDRPGPADLCIPTLAEQLYRERVAEARAMSPEDKLLAGEELFAYACSITLAGIRDQFPGISPEECLRILETRLALRERMEQRA